MNARRVGSFGFALKSGGKWNSRTCPRVIANFHALSCSSSISQSRTK